MRQPLSACRLSRLCVGSAGRQALRRLAIGGVIFLLAAAPAAAENVIRVSANTPVRSLDPAKFSLGALEFNYALLVYSRLTYFDDNLSVIPDLAESWEASLDQTVWTFHLRHGVKFHDGRELDAEDVLATFKRLADPAIGSVIRTTVGLIDKAEAPDKYTVRFTLIGVYRCTASAASPATPAAPHALYMPSHIYSMRGIWEDSVRSNFAAKAAADDYAAQSFLDWTHPRYPTFRISLSTPTCEQRGTAARNRLSSCPGTP